MKLEDRVILDVMDDHILAPERFLENYVLISLLEVCQELGGQERGVHGVRLGFLMGDLEDRVILDKMDDLGR